MKTQFSSLVEAELRFDDQDNDEEKYIMSMVEAAVTKTLNKQNEPKTQAKPKVSFESIIKNAKNNGSDKNI